MTDSDTAQGVVRATLVDGHLTAAIETQQPWAHSLALSLVADTLLH
jgi:hypothetical protein